MPMNVPRREFLGCLVGGSGGLLAPGALRAQPAGQPAAPTAGWVSVRDIGAAGDGTRLDTPALQRAIDRCAQNGGGTVWFPPGRYLSGTLFLRSHVALELAQGAVLLGSPQLKDYPPMVPKTRSYTDNYTDKSLLYGEELEGVALRGAGVLDGQGANFKGAYKLRPYMVRLIGCRDVVVTGVTFRNSPMWVQHYLACDSVLLDGVTVDSHCNSNNDGIDIDGCQRVRISNCQISSGDDAIVLKSTLDRPCQDVVIANCVLSSDCNAFKLGTESNGGFEGIVLANCAIHRTRLAGIALELVDGGCLDQVNLSNVTMREVGCPIFIRLGNRARPFQNGNPKPAVGRLRGVTISHVQATATDPVGCSITGIPDHPAEDIVIEDIQLRLPGGGAEADARRQPPEQEEKYPEYAMFGRLPAAAFFCRHVRNLRFRHVRLSVRRPDARPSFVGEDLEGLELDGWQAGSAPAEGVNPVVRLRDVRQALLHACVSPADAASFLAVEGRRSDRIRLTGNDLTSARKAIECGPEVGPQAVTSDR